jgi:peptidoglycan/xylan/chitin deacetylase (PgdA/CDA1 family)
MTDVRWPNGARCAVALTFDVDAESLFLADKENATRPKTLSMGTYGPLRGVPRLLDILDRQEVRATFFMPGWTIDHWPERTREIAARGHEIAVHGDLHENFSNLSPDQQRAVHKRSLEAAERVTGRRPVGVRPPGEYTPETLRIVHEMGFLYDSNMRGDDRPYRVHLDNQPTDLIEIAAHWELDDAPYFFFGHGKGNVGVRIQSPRAAYEAWTEEFDGYYRYGLCYVLMTHPQLIGKPGRALMLEQVIEHIKRHDKVWFATCEEIARWWLESGQP